MADGEQLSAIIKLVANDGGGMIEQLELKVDSVVHTITRNPVVFPLPAINKDAEGAEAGMPMVFALDFGLLSEQITLSGVLNDNESPTHQDLANAARTWWRELDVGSSATIEGYNKLKFNEGGIGSWTYGVVIQQLTCQREGGRLYWTFKLTCQVVAFPPLATW